MTHQLSDRNQLLLEKLIGQYIDGGIPVASKTLSSDKSIGLSAASIRSVMGELEELGYLMSPHTSAGRIPTEQGYRFFVDQIIKANIAVENSEQIAKMKAMIDQQVVGNLLSEPGGLAESASSMLSSLTRQAGLVLLPKLGNTFFRQIEFLPLSGSKVLVILVLNEQDVQNRVIETDREFSTEELAKAAAFVNENFGGRDLQEVRSDLLASMRKDKSLIDELMESMLSVANTALQSVEDKASDYVVSGETNLMESAISGPVNVERLRELFDAFHQKRDILDLMERCSAAQGVQVFIGEESGYDVLGDFSVVTAPYEVGGEALGVLGVIGPTRMAYQRVVPMVDVTAKLISASLKS